MLIFFRIHPDAGEDRYTYDNAGDLLKENNPLGQINYDYTYYRVLQKRHSNMTGNDVTYTYDALHRLANLQSTDSLGNLMQDIDYTFDNASNVTRIVNNAGHILV